MRNPKLNKIFQGLVISNIFILVCSLGRLEIYSYFVVWFLIAITTLANLFQPAYSPLSVKKNENDGGTLLLLIWSVYIPQILSLGYAFNYNALNFYKLDLVTTLAIIICILGLLLRASAYLALGKFFTADIVFQDDQTIIDSGPFKYIRHPSYTGAILIYTMFPIIVKSWSIVPFAFFFLLFSLIRRMNLEEKFLLSKLGDDYLEFCNSRKRLIPFIY